MTGDNNSLLIERNKRAVWVDMRGDDNSLLIERNKWAVWVDMRGHDNSLLIERNKRAVWVDMRGDDNSLLIERNKRAVWVDMRGEDNSLLIERNKRAVWVDMRKDDNSLLTERTKPYTTQADTQGLTSCIVLAVCTVVWSLAWVHSCRRRRSGCVRPAAWRPPLRSAPTHGSCRVVAGVTYSCLAVYTCNT